jgi:hypothetical protein
MAEHASVSESQKSTEHWMPSSHAGAGPSSHTLPLQISAPLQKTLSSQSAFVRQA